MTYPIHAEGLSKRYGDTVALDGADLCAAAGTVLAVLGPNGAGKTTAIRILATLIRPDAGWARINGDNVLTHPARVRRAIGLTGQYAALDEDLTGTENLTLIGQLLDLRRTDAKARAAELLTRFGLDDDADRRLSAYSGGMRRRLDLAACLVGEPRVAFLDEPTTGLDPGRREDLWRMIRTMTSTGTTVLLTTQYLEEADALAERVAVLDHGRVIADGTPAELKQRVGGHTIALRPSDPGQREQAAAILRQVAGNTPEPGGGGLLTVPVTHSTAADDSATLRLLLDHLNAAAIPVAEVSLRLPSLDDVFFTLTGNPTHADTDQEQPR